MTLLRVVSRPMLSSIFVYGGVQSLRNAPAMAAKVRPVSDKALSRLHDVAPQVPESIDPATLVRINGAVHVVVGAMLATGRLPRLSGLLLAATLVPTTLVGHRFWNESDPGMRANQTTHFLKNVSLIGGLLMASLDPEPHKKILARRAKDSLVEAVHDIRA